MEMCECKQVMDIDITTENRVSTFGLVYQQQEFWWYQIL